MLGLRVSHSTRYSSEYKLRRYVLQSVSAEYSVRCSERCFPPAGFEWLSLIRLLGRAAAVVSSLGVLVTPLGTQIEEDLHRLMFETDKP